MIDPLTVSISAARFLTLSLHLPRLLRQAAVPLTFGILWAVGSGAIYGWQLVGHDLADYFSSAAQVGVGVLLALILQGVIKVDGDEPLVRGLRVGTLALTAAGTAASLIGLVVSGAVASGIMFALTWGGLAAGVVGLLVFIGDPATTSRVAAAGAEAEAPLNTGGAERAAEDD